MVPSAPRMAPDWAGSDMLTRLQVSGFKNLVDVDVRFGPFTCIAGPNGAGKSNLFDAIHFLSLLAGEKTLLEAALHVRDEEGRLGDIHNLFHRVGNKYDQIMSFAAEMIVPSKGQDEWGQEAQATRTFLTYKLKLGYRADPPGLEILTEELTPIPVGDFGKHLLFLPRVQLWRDNPLLRKTRTVPFISTESDGGIVHIHQDAGGRKGAGRGGTIKRSIAGLTRTVLSAANAAESPTATLAKKEMLSWRLLQLEPSKLRCPDTFSSPTTIGPDGSFLAATLYRLAQQNGEMHKTKDTQRTYATIANRLSELVEAVRGISVDRDVKRELLTLEVTDREGTPLPAMSLSDGTLRFLALAVLEMDPLSQGVICLEEPENGIHPERIPAMLRLLQDIATDPEEPVDETNPLRQVIVNTHSPVVVGQVPDGDLLVAELRERISEGARFRTASFLPLPQTWRAEEDGIGCVSRGKLLPYLSPLASPPEEPKGEQRTPKTRVADRKDINPWLPFESERGT